MELTRGTAAEFIRRRRLQIVIHSCIYYRLNENLVSDHQWAAWAKELVEAQERFPDIAEKQLWAKEFADFDGSTGFNLPITEPGVVARARSLVSYSKKLKEKEK